MKPKADNLPLQNKLLGAFTAEAFDRIKRHIRPVAMKLGAVVCDAGGVLEHVYFPQGSVLSLLTVLENGSALECANIGREGAFGIFSSMYGGVSFNRCIIQLEGPMVRCPIEPLRLELEKDSRLQNVFVSYSEALLSQIMQSVACSAFHTVEERMCRWLLMIHDRAEGELLTYTHEFLAQILGANRTSATLAARSLQNRGLIRYGRGAIQIQDRAGMEQASCECYAVVRERLVPLSTRP